MQRVDIQWYNKRNNPAVILELKDGGVSQNTINKVVEGIKNVFGDIDVLVLPESMDITIVEKMVDD